MIEIAITNINYIKVQNCIVDRIEVREQTSNIDLSSTKSDWQIDTVMIAEFLGNLEAGNVNNEGLEITKFKIKRRNSGELTSITLGELDYDAQNPTTLEFTDFTQPVGNLVYSIVPVGVNGLEGKESSKQITSDFIGWYIVDKNNNSVLQMNTCIEEPSIAVQLNQNRIEIETMSEYPSVYYLPRRNHSFTLSAVIVPANYSVTEWNNIVTMIERHIPLIVKSSSGDIYVCDVSAPSKQMLFSANARRGYDYIQLSLNCSEIMSYSSYMNS